jgi:metal-responsive CopG/Arc/MetJ family transcriptional regulator
MNTVRVNITLPMEIAQMLRNVKNKSAFIAEAIRERIEREEKSNLIKELTEGYQIRRKEDNELADTITVLPVTPSVGKVYPFEVFLK